MSHLLGTSWPVRSMRGRLKRRITQRDLTSYIWFRYCDFQFEQTKVSNEFFITCGFLMVSSRCPGRITKAWVQLLSQSLLTVTLELNVTFRDAGSHSELCVLRERPVTSHQLTEFRVLTSVLRCGLLRLFKLLLTISHNSFIPWKTCLYLFFFFSEVATVNIVRHWKVTWAAFILTQLTTYNQTWN